MKCYSLPGSADETMPARTAGHVRFDCQDTERRHHQPAPKFLSRLQFLITHLPLAAIQIAGGFVGPQQHAALLQFGEIQGDRSTLGRIQIHRHVPLRAGPEKR